MDITRARLNLLIEEIFDLIRVVDNHVETVMFRRDGDQLLPFWVRIEVCGMTSRQVLIKFKEAEANHGHSNVIPDSNQELVPSINGGSPLPW